MNILLLMAGKGQRFIDAKYKLPKPLIDINGTPMVEFVVRNLLDNGVRYFNDKKADGGIFAFWNDNPKWSYLRINNGLVTEVVEKQVISNIANTGTYYFKKGSDFVKAAEQMISYNIRTNGEFYLAPCYNQMILDGKKILPYLTNQMVPLGDPISVERFTNGSI